MLDEGRVDEVVKVDCRLKWRHNHWFLRWLPTGHPRTLKNASRNLELITFCKANKQGSDEHWIKYYFYFTTNEEMISWRQNVITIYIEFDHNCSALEFSTPKRMKSPWNNRSELEPFLLFFMMHKTKKLLWVKLTTTSSLGCQSRVKGKQRNW